MKQSRSPRWLRLSFVLCVLGLLLTSGHAMAGTAAAPPPAAMITVTTNSDTSAAGSCTLRDAITTAVDTARNNTATTDCITGPVAGGGNGASTITFAPGLAGQTITLSSALPTIIHPITINGPGADKLTIDANNVARIFSFNFTSTSTSTSTVSGLTLKNGAVTGSNQGGAILALFGGGAANSLVLNGLAVTNNKAAGGGGGVATGSGIALLLINSTLSGNSVTAASGFLGGAGGTAKGGALFVNTGSTASIVNSTLSGNNVQGGAGGQGFPGSQGMSGTPGTPNLPPGCTPPGNPVGTCTAGTPGTPNGNGGPGGNGGAGGNGLGGAIYSSGTLTLTHASLSNNTALAGIGGTGGPGGPPGTGGTGGSQGPSGSNGAAGSALGAGLYEDSGAITLKNSLIANSTPAAQDCASIGGTQTLLGSLIQNASASCGCNAVGTAVCRNGDPLLNALANNGGTTQTHSLQATSPAIGVADATTCLNAPVGLRDQRGLARPAATCDIGAFQTAVDCAVSATVMSCGTSTGVTSATVPDINAKTVTVSIPSGTLGGLRRVTTPANLPAGVTFPNGFFAFDIGGLATGGTTTVTINLPAGTNPTSYVKCRRDGTSCDVLPSTGTGAKAVINGDTVTLTLVDGDVYDADGVANGSVSDPGGPGIGGAAAGSASGGGALSMSLLAILGMFSLIAFIGQRRKRL